MRYFCSVFTLLFILSCVNLALCQDLTSPQAEVMKNLSAFTSSWNNNVDPCLWAGVFCSDGAVIELKLSGLGFKYNIWKTVCELPALKRLDVSNNSLSTPYSGDIIACTNLTHLNVSSNLLSGTFPLLDPLKKLQSLDLSRNMLEGNFEFQVKNLTELQFLYLGYNKFTGSIPYVIRGQKLEHLDVSRNKLDGEIPQRLVEYTNLNSLDLSSNLLNGTIPENIGSLLNLQSLVLSANKLSGSIPKTLGKLNKLTRFAVNYNKLSGTIPIELSSITGLESLDLSYNNLHGSIPPEVFGAKNLKSLDLSDNSLSGSIPQNFSRNLFRLRIGNNNLNGIIPSTIGDALELTYLEMNNNILGGDIPVQLGSCTKLQLLDLGENQLRGPLTSVLPELRDLQYLKLPNNYFEGSIINELSLLPNLTYVDLGGNRLSESISSKICQPQRLQNLRLQNNHLIGPIPQDISNCQNLLELQLGSNKLNGSIPQGISKLNRLQIALNLSSNALDGTIPGLLSSLVTLEILDLSNNRLTGGIPISLVDMKSLTVLNLSNNQLTGIIPSSLNRSSLVLKTEGNPGLSFGQSHSPVSNKKKVPAGLLVGVAIGGAIFALGAVALSMLACKYLKHNEPEVQEMQESHKIEGHFIHSDSIHNLSINFEKGVEATMDPANVVLKNKFSTYYKAAMPSGTSYSVKKLSWTDKIFKTGSYRKLEAELEKQGRLNHPNIMIPLAYVLDTECVYLFYEYVHKGTLAEFLHTSGVCVLDWPSRCNIAIGIAQGLAFLHGCQHPILHLDLTTKNILLKSLSEAQLADVELCKMVDPSKSTGSLSAIAGSVGYVPPEYAYTMRVTAAGNVYSFGVILLELLTGKPPITGGMDIAKWVQSTLSGEEAWEQILDMRIRNFSLQIQNEMLSMLKLALSCISSSPDARPKMRTVVGTLQHIRHSP